MRGY
ncbi:hypothetical protein BpHYR1_037175 [Brachionus plicatilis]